ncbi:MAG TPA: class E sortase [Mycobacteriales bacterium]|jgi:sortase A|nr:class E sortase [Mycobacteriales bacterium]
MADTTTAPAPPAMRGDAWRTAARGVGQLLITLGIVILLFVVYELWGTSIYTRGQQHQLEDTIQHGWQTSAPDITQVNVKEVPLGSGIAVLRIPRFGRGYHMVIVEGTNYDDLTKGPGHYPGTALPGQVGNFAVAGHRTTYLAPFNRIDTLRRGDAIVLETKSNWLVYRVQDIPAGHGYPNVPYREIVDPTDVKVAFAVPDQPNPDKKPRLKLLTFTSCNPKYSAAQRYVIHAELVLQQPKSDGPPAALTTRH